MAAAAFELLFIVVGIVMVVQEDSPSIGLHIGLIITMAIGWVIVRLAKSSLREVLDTIAHNT